MNFHALRCHPWPCTSLNLRFVADLIPSAFSYYLLAHANEHRDIFPAMVSQRGGAVIQHLLRQILVNVVREDVKSMGSWAGGAKVPAEAAVQFVAGALFGLLMWWMGGRMRLSVEEVNGIFRRLAIPAVKAGFPLSDGIAVHLDVLFGLPGS